MKQDYSTNTDLKLRWGGLLENPYLSKVQRHCLDGFKVRGLSNIIRSFQFKSILDVGCGLGEYSHVTQQKYVGLDNSLPRVAFAQRAYRKHLFVNGDARNLPFKNNSFEAVLLANTIHHLSDEELTQTLGEIKRVTQKYIIIDDCVKTSDQSRLSQFFYGLDRGTTFRTPDQLEYFFKNVPGIRILLQNAHRTFPGLYFHSVFVLDVTK